MKSLSELSNDVISILQSSSLCVQVHIVETRSFSETQFRLKLRADLQNNTTLQVYLYVNNEHVDYSYQLLQSQLAGIRWDNKEHFPSISSYPHHFHADNANVQESSLTGEPKHDLAAVLDYLATHKINLD